MMVCKLLPIIIGSENDIKENKKKVKFKQGEVALSDHTDLNTVSCISGKVSVKWAGEMSEEKLNKWLEQDDSHLFFS